MNADHLKHVVGEWADKLSGFSEQQSMEIAGTKWTRKQLLGHLIDSTANNHHRFVRLQQGNLIGFPAYEQEHWVFAGNYNENSWSNLVGLWRLYNLQLAIVVENIDPQCENNVWEGHDADLRFLVEDFVRHQVHHLKQMA